MNPAEAAVRGRIRERGSIPMEELVELALYHPEGGFYTSGGHAGRGGDFMTSPEVGPLFGAVVARALDGWWREAGEPATFRVVEAGAGPGALARAVRAAAPACSSALEYVLVEVSAPQREMHARALPPSADVEARFVSTDQLPGPNGPTIVLANELLDNLPFGLLERGEAGWSEVCIGLDGEELVELLEPLAASDAPAVDARPGARIPRQRAAAAWLQQALAIAGDGGRVAVFDYATTSHDMAARPWRDWVRTYRGHRHGSHPLEHVGEQDITCEVAVDLLPVAPDVQMDQPAWLRTHGIEELVDEGRRIWHERASIGDLAAVKARSRVTEAEALLDPDGLGAFSVLEWHGWPQPRT